MYCDNCGCELEENAEKCPVCGKEFHRVAAEKTSEAEKVENAVPSQEDKKVNTTILENTTEKTIPEGADIMIKKKGEKKSMSKGAKAALITIPIVVVASIGMMAYIYVPKFRNYNDANAKLAAGEVDDAVAMYKDLGDFKDASVKASGGAFYDYAKELEKSGNNLEAAEYYEKAGKYNYEDAAIKSEQCYYNAGMDQMNAASYDAAISSFSKAGTYNNGDAEQRMTECKYKKAELLISSEDYDEAITLLSSIEEYSDSKTLLAKCYYSKGEVLLKTGNYDDAYDMYMKSEYDDYKKRANECIYRKANELYNNKEYKQAIDTYKKVDKSYKDCVKEKDKCYSALGSESYKSKEYKQAVEYFQSVEKADVSKKIDKSKLAYIKQNKNATNTTTMEYLGQLRYAGNSTAQKIYSELVKWDITSYVNNDEKDYDKQLNSIKGSGDIYIHTSFAFSGDDTMNISGYVVYADGNKSESIAFADPIVNDWSTWVKISGDNAPKGVTYLYLVNDATNNIIEVYPFTIK